jgi:G3E family GTPase
VLQDFVNAALDAATLQQLCADVRRLSASCVCCDGEAALLEELGQCRLGERDVMVLEVSGTSDPLPLIELLLLDPVGRRYRPLRQVTVVDALRWQQRGPNDELERMQARGATHVMFSWEDAVSAERRAAVRQAVAQLNPAARPVTDDELLEELVRTASSGSLDVEMLPAGGIIGRAWSAVSLRPTRHHHHDLAHRFGARQMELPRRVSRAQLTGWLDALPPGILRAKGVVELADSPGRYHYFNRVGDRCALGGFPFDPPENRTLALLVGVVDVVNTVPELTLDSAS